MKSLKLGPERPDPSVVEAVDAIDRECLAVTQRLREANEADLAIPLEELAALAERDVERCRFLVDHEVIPPELFDDAVLRSRRIRAMMSGGRQ